MSWNLTITDVLQATRGKALGQFSTEWTGVSTDTRLAMKQHFFIALRGENFDAHDFVDKAVEQGATGILIDKMNPALEFLAKKVTLVQVADTLKGLQDLGHYWRKKNNAKIVAITGSTGKTTTKEFAASILQKSYKTHFSRGSFNNHWGVPLTLLGIQAETEVAVVEMGMNHSGELTELCKIAEPDVTLVTNVGSAHIGELGSQEAVVQAKWEIYRACPKALPIYNLVNEHTIRMHQEAIRQGVGNLLTFSNYKSDSHVSLRVTEVGLDFIKIMGLIAKVPGEVTIPVFGRQNGMNVMAAAAIGLALNMQPEEIWRALSDLKTAWGRNQIVHLPNGTPVLFDGYNANPESMAALIKNLFEISNQGKKVYVLGEMLELGKESPRFHQELGEMIGNTDADVVWFVGPHQADFERGIKQSPFSKNLILSDSYKEELASQVGSMLNPSDIVAIKGSRGMKLEQVLRAWNPVDF